MWRSCPGFVRLAYGTPSHSSCPGLATTTPARFSPAACPLPPASCPLPPAPCPLTPYPLAPFLAPSDTVCDNAAKWVNDSRIAWAYPPAPAAAAPSAPGASPPPPPAGPPSSLSPVQLGCPYLLMPHAPLAPAHAPGGLPFDPASERFSGAFYVKVPSVAQLMEWVWLDSLRAMDTPW